MPAPQAAPTSTTDNKLGFTHVSVCFSLREEKLLTERVRSNLMVDSFLANAEIDE